MEEISLSKIRKSAMLLKYKSDQVGAGAEGEVSEGGQVDAGGVEGAGAGGEEEEAGFGVCVCRGGRENVE